MAAPPWRKALPAHFHAQHDTYNIKYNNTSTYTNRQSPFHNKTDLCAHAREMHITLRKITGSHIPFYFNIESHNGRPTIAYYICNVNDHSIQKTLDSTLSNTNTNASSDSSISSYTSTSSTCPHITSNVTHKTVTSHHSTIITIDKSLRNTNIRILSCSEPTEIASRLSTDTNLMAQISDHKKQAQDFALQLEYLCQDN